MSVNGTPRNIKPARKSFGDRMLDQVIKANDWIGDHPAQFMIGATVFTAGVWVGVACCKVPAISEAEVLNKWLTDANAAGISIYGLTAEQKKLWETIWQYVEAESKQYGLPASKIVGELIADYASVSRYRGTFPRAV